MRSAEDQARVRRTIALAARMIEQGDPNTHLVGSVRVAPLDKNGKPKGKPVEIGPVVMSWEPEWNQE